MSLMIRVMFATDPAFFMRTSLAAEVKACDSATPWERIEENGTITQYGANGWGSWTLPVAQDVWSAGGCFYYNEDLTEICVDDPATIKVLQDEADLMNVDKAQPSALNPPSSPVSLLSGKVATEIKAFAAWGGSGPTVVRLDSDHSERVG